LVGKAAIVLVCDGMADRPVQDYKFKTPLEVANTPHMSRLTKAGSVGLMDPVRPGVIPGSDVAHFALLGYDPYQYYTGRGSLEAEGAGITLKPGDVAFRCNFATVDENMKVIDRRAGRIKAGTSKLAKVLNKMQLEAAPGVKVQFQKTVEHRGVLVFSGEGISRMVSDVDPHSTGVRILKSKPQDGTEEAARTAEGLNEFVRRSYELLKDHPVNIERAKKGQKPANIILPRGPGTLPSITPLPELYNMKAACIAAVAMVRGICKIAGMSLLDVKGATGGLNTDFLAKARAAVEASKGNDLVFVNVKACDVASHDGDFKTKVKIIERIDEMVGLIIDKVGLSTDYFAVTCDHCTPVNVRDHTSDPVPLAIAGPDVPSSRIPKFTENHAAAGNIGRIPASSLIPTLMDYLGKAEKFGF